MKNASSKITLLLLFAAALLFTGCATPLMNATERGDTKEMERLIAAGANVNQSTSATPLYMAVLHNASIDIVRLLLDKGADVNKGLGNGWKPIHLAVDHGNANVVKLLLDRGADITTMNAYGKTPIKMAEEKGSTVITRILREAEEKQYKTLLSAMTEPSNPAEENAFTEAARSYRAATVKPTLPEEARKFKVQAESAFNKKNFEGAAARYKDALDVAPWWPEGHFNRALILGELSRYRDAIREMKKYLTLVPDAPNARAAQDNIYRWEGELK